MASLADFEKLRVGLIQKIATADTPEKISALLAQMNNIPTADNNNDTNVLSFFHSYMPSVRINPYTNFSNAIVEMNRPPLELAFLFFSSSFSFSSSAS